MGYQLLLSSFYIARFRLNIARFRLNIARFRLNNARFRLTSYPLDFNLCALLVTAVCIMGQNIILDHIFFLNCRGF